jgi:RES domain-containing protein
MNVVYRSAEWDTPWWAGPNRAPGRFNRSLTEPTQYLCEHPLTCFAERLRGLGREAAVDLATMRWRCWVMDVRLEDLTTIDFDSSTTFGIAADDLVADDWSACQLLAERRRAAGDPGIIVPSAALPGTRNVVLFGPRVASPFLLPPVDADIENPSAHAAEFSEPPAEIVNLIRWHGEPHAGLHAWHAGEPFVFLDPPTPRATAPGRR